MSKKLNPEEIAALMSENINENNGMLPDFIKEKEEKKQEDTEVEAEKDEKAEKE